MTGRKLGRPPGRRPAAHLAIEQVECEEARGGCGARGADGDKPGEQCRTPAGNPAVVPHSIRRSLAAQAGTYMPR
jgi:hypothetical protein